MREAAARPALGFVGLGVMGAPLAAHLASRADAPVLGYDIDVRARDRVARDGVTPAGSLEAVARAAEVVFLSLPGEAEVEAVCAGTNGLFAHARPGAIVVDMSTVPVAAVRRLVADANRRGIGFADAPVAGTAESVRERRASVMVGATPESFARIEPLLACMAGEVLHCGPCGSGATTKLLVNAVIAQTGVALAETLALARRAGIDGATLFEAFERGCDSFVLRHHGRLALLPGDFPPGRFSTRYMLKDLRYALALGGEHASPLEGTATAARWLEASMGAGDADAYWPALLRRLEACRIAEEETP